MCDGQGYGLKPLRGRPYPFPLFLRRCKNSGIVFRDSEGWYFSVARSKTVSCNKSVIRLVRWIRPVWRRVR